ncbi:MAG: hypothetical protein ACI8ZX_002821, partial [Planctomycetota bacterium]
GVPPSKLILKTSTIPISKMALDTLSFNNIPLVNI